MSTKLFRSSVAATIFEEPWVKELCAQISNELKDHIEWIEVRHTDDQSGLKMLDYACGNGIASRVSPEMRSSDSPLT